MKKRTLFLITGVLIALTACCVCAGCVSEDSDSIIGVYSTPLLGTDGSTQIGVTLEVFDTDNTMRLFTVYTNGTVIKHGIYSWEKTGNGNYASGTTVYKKDGDGSLIKVTNEGSENGKEYHLTRYVCEGSPILGAWQWYTNGKMMNDYIQFNSDGTFLDTFDMTNGKQGIKESTYHWKRIGDNLYTQHIGDDYAYDKYYLSSDGTKLYVVTSGSATPLTYLRVNETSIPK